MMAVVILVFSLISLLLFFLSYCRSLVASSTKEALPQEVVDVTGITHPSSPDDFSRVMQLLKLCPDRPEERGKLRAIAAYYRFSACSAPRWRCSSLLCRLGPKTSEPIARISLHCCSAGVLPLAVICSRSR
jgi:hypothetical protein